MGKGRHRVAGEKGGRQAGRERDPSPSSTSPFQYYLMLDICKVLPAEFFPDLNKESSFCNVANRPCISSRAGGGFATQDVQSGDCWGECGVEVYIRILSGERH